MYVIVVELTVLSFREFIQSKAVVLNKAKVVNAATLEGSCFLFRILWMIQCGWCCSKFDGSCDMSMSLYFAWGRHCIFTSLYLSSSL